jgi:PIN domain nuclease of toxin-antitoxin system
MICVTDTHPFIFYATGVTKKLSRAALRTFTRAENGRATIYIPTVCFFELSLLLEGGSLRSNVPFAEWKRKVEASGAFLIESLTWEDVEEARALRALVDPFDRLIAGVANRLQCPLITRDERITDSGLVATIW